MRKVYIKGYINFNDKRYTFIYEDKKLTLISVENDLTFFSEYKYVNYFEGFTLDGFDIVFYINDSIYYKNGSYVCSPRCILIARSNEYRINKMCFNSLKIIGGTVNRFYSNCHMIGIDFNKYCNISSVKDCFKIKTIEDSTSEEKVKLNGNETNFELSIALPGWQDDGRITFDDFNSVLRIKYNNNQNYDQVVKDLGVISNFFRFCSNRNNISYESVYLECKNEKNKYYNAVEIIIPYMIDNVVKKDMIDYETIKNNVGNIIEFLDKCDYIFSIIPDSDKDLNVITNKDYCAAFSCFESIYQFVHSDTLKEKLSTDEKELEEAKKEVLLFLENLDKKYHGNNGKRRRYIKRFEHIISNTNLKKESCIITEVNKNEYIINNIYYKLRNELQKCGINNSIEKAINDRDNITHNRTVNLDNISIGIYQIVLKLNYSMILEFVGISKEQIKKNISYLILRNVI